MAKVISFINQKGGVGKSVLADELAFEFDRLGLKYNLYDIDNQGGLLHQTSDDKDADYYIVDTPGHLNKNVVDIIRNSDIIIVPTRASVKEIPPLQRTLDVIKSAKQDKATVMIVLNGWNSYTTYSQFEEWLRGEYPEFDKMVTLPQAEPLAQAGFFGKSVIEYKPRNKASEQLKKLWTIVEYELNIKL